MNGKRASLPYPVLTLSGNVARLMGRCNTLSRLLDAHEHEVIIETDAALLVSRVEAMQLVVEKLHSDIGLIAKYMFDNGLDQ